MNHNNEKIEVIPAQKDNLDHQKGIWIVRNDNINFDLITKEEITYEQHCVWWDKIHDYEYVYVIIFQGKVIGYIRLTKLRTKFKEKNEVSIAIAKDYHNKGFGSQAYEIFEKEMKSKGVSAIIASTHVQNIQGQKFFEKNKFERTYLRYTKKLN